MSSQLRRAIPLREQSSFRHIEATETASIRREYDGVTLAVYLAKAPGRRWVSSTLRDLVAQARSSYQMMYGSHVTIFDEYDEKSWIYAAIATYECRGSTFDEVLTLRFVPTSGLPFGSDDLNCYMHKGLPEQDLPTLLAGGTSKLRTAHTLRGCYSQGRMGAIRPSTQAGDKLPGNRYVGLAWCSMLECFLEASEQTSYKCTILTSQTTEHLRVLGAKIPTQPCDEFLGYEPRSIILNRKATRVRELCYGVPTYFLNLKDVGALLSRLISEGRLSRESVQNATTPGVTLERALQRPQPATFKRLHLLFGARNLIGNRSLSSGEELRSLADDQVRDGPVLRLTNLEELKVQLRELRRRATPARPLSFIRASGAQQ
jgi:hypothetical protein